MNKIDIEIDLNKDYTQRVVQGMQVAEFTLKINSIKMPKYYMHPVFHKNNKVSEEQIIGYIVTYVIQNAFDYLKSKTSERFTDYGGLKAIKSIPFSEEDKEFIKNYGNTKACVKQASILIAKYFNVSFVADIKRIIKWAAR